jgi:dinuclear metal center YbgI/SA1388 family protein
MATIQQVINSLENWAPPAYQESYDNSGLLTGNALANCTGILTTLDCTEAVVQEAIAKQCNLIVAHHPILFSGLKKITGKNYIEKTIIAAIKNDIAIYAIHTNADNVLHGVNHFIAQQLQLQQTQILQPKTNTLIKLYTYVPNAHAAAVKDALFAVGAGQIGNYSECSFTTQGKGSFKANSQATPFVGQQNLRHEEPETKIEVIAPAYLQTQLVTALKQAHPYEEVAYEIIALQNTNPTVGSGMVGVLETAVATTTLLQQLKQIFNVPMLKHTNICKKKVQKIAVCGGSGSFLIGAAKAAKADVYITADMKYHDYFDAENQLVVVDVGHFETEQFVAEGIKTYLQDNFTTFAVLKSEVVTNPVHYF